jgi:hypothetical protein
MIKDVTKAPLVFRESLRRIYLGDPSHEHALEITDEVVATMIEALPNLQHVRIDGAPKVSDRTVLALFGLEDVRSITLTATQDHANRLRRKTLEDAP